MSETNTAILGASTIALPVAIGYFGKTTLWIMAGILVSILIYTIIVNIKANKA